MEHANSAALPRIPDHLDSPPSCMHDHSYSAPTVEAEETDLRSAEIDRLKRGLEKFQRAFQKEKEKVTNLRKRLRDAVRKRCRQDARKKSVDFSKVASRIVNADRPKKQREWSKDMKVLCLAIHYHSPKAYRYLRQLLILPSETTLRRCFDGLRSAAGICEPLMEALRNMVATMTEEKFCVVSFDEMALKMLLSYRRYDDLVEGFVDHCRDATFAEYANQALVYTASRIHVKWTQSAGYVVSNSATPARVIERLLREFIGKLFDIGLIVKLVVCDQGLTN